MTDPARIDPILAIIDHEVGKLQTIHAFKMSGIVHPARNVLEKRKNACLRKYHHTLNTAVEGLQWLKVNYEYTEFRKEVHKWATTLYKDGRRKILNYSDSATNRAAGRAYMDVSKAIIDSFKKLPR